MSMSMIEDIMKATIDARKEIIKETKEIRKRKNNSYYESGN